MKKTLELPTSQQALPDRAEKIEKRRDHTVLSSDFDSLPSNTQSVMFGLGCFWGAERKFWQVDGVLCTAVGYSAGVTVNPTYDDVCSGMTGHNEVVKVWYDPDQLDFYELLKVFWLNHDPTQGMRQGNDIGTQYRSGIYTTNDAQQALAEKSKQQFQQQLHTAGYGDITTEILPVAEFYLAEDYHQQYLDKNPMGYCGIGGLNVPFE